MRHDSLGEARAVASGARLFLWLASGGARCVTGSVRGSFLATRPAYRTAEELGLILHHIDALATPRRRCFADRCGRLYSLDDWLWLIGDGLHDARWPFDRRLLDGLTAVFRPLRTLEAFGTVLSLLPLDALRSIMALATVATIVAVIPITAVEPAVAEAGIVAAAVRAVVLMAALLGAPILPVLPILMGTTVVLAAILVARIVARFLTGVGAPLVTGLTLLAGLARERRHRGLVAHAGINGFRIIAVGVLAVLVHRPHPMTIGAGHVAALLDLLLAVRNDHTIVVFGVLEIVLCEHGIARGLRIARQRHVFARDIRRGAADFYVRSVGFEAPG